MSKLIRIPYEQLPDFNAVNENYKVRYRLKSDDGNRSSAWSPIYNLNPGFSYTAEYDMVVEKESGGYTRLVWEPVKVIDSSQNVIAEVPAYDIWVRYSSEYGDNSQWSYQERVSSTSLNIFQPPLIATVKYISIEVYAPTVQGRIVRRQSFDVYQDSVHIDLVKDTILFDQDIDFFTGQLVGYTTDDVFKISPNQTGNEIQGLPNGSEWYVRVVDLNTISLHPTQEDAVNNTNRVDLQSHPNTVGYFRAMSCTLCDYLLYSKYYNNI